MSRSAAATEAGDIAIRRATPDDAAGISRLVSSLSRDFITSDYSPEGAASLLSRQTPEAIATVITEGTTYFVAESGGALIGAAGIIPQHRHLYHLFVHSDFQRQGIGRRLWNELQASVGTGPVTVNSSRLAIDFYKRLGFHPAGPAWEKQGVIAYPMVWEPAVISGRNPPTPG